MSIIVEREASFYAGFTASVVEEDREIAWAQPHVRKAPDVKWILGNFVQAATPEVPTYNSNGHSFPYEDLKDAILGIPHRPLNLIHQANRRVGTYTAAEFVWPNGEEADENASIPPTVEALAAFWHYYEPELWPSIEMAYKEGQLFFCVDTETELLTEDGWKHYDELEVGEQILTLNTETSLSEWTPMEALSVFDRDGDMIRMEGLMHSSLTTPNHRWWVKRHSPKTGLDTNEWRTTDTLTQQTWIPRCAPHGDFPALPKYSDDFVELMAWFWTEGTIHGSSSTVYQSTTHNPVFCDRISAALTRLYGPPARVKDGGVWYVTDRPYSPDHPLTAEGEPGVMRHFHLSKAATEPILEVGGKIPLPSFLRSLTESQLKLFVDTSLDADGDRAKSGQLGIKQRDLGGLRMFEMACVLLGIPTNTRKCSDGSWRTGIVQRSTMINPHQAADSTKARKSGEGFTIATEHYQGKVWCPTTKNGTFFARRNGSVYITGNSMEAVPETITCRGKGGFEGCGQTYEYAGRQSPTYCKHLNEHASRKTLNKPVFTGGALIIPPVKPGWKNAEVKELSQLLESSPDDAETVYEQVSASAPHLDSKSWENIAAWFLKA